MAQPQVSNIPQMSSNPAKEREKALRILAKSIFKELKSQGYDYKQIVGVATELIAQVTSDLNGSGSDTSR